MIYINFIYIYSTASRTSLLYPFHHPYHTYTTDILYIISLLFIYIMCIINITPSNFFTVININFINITPPAPPK